MIADGRRVLVTGATGAIGSAIVAALGERGIRTVAVGRRFEGDESPAVERLRLDLTDERDLETLRARSASPDIGGLVHVAGITGPRIPAWEDSADSWDRMAAINVRPVIVSCAAAAAGWIARGETGAIVTMSSPGAVRAHRHRAVYDASRAAVEAYTRGLAVDLGPHGVRANALRPAAVGLPAPEAPLGRGASPDEVAAAALFLLGAEGVTGHALDVDGGLLGQLRPPADDRRHEERGSS